MASSTTESFEFSEEQLEFFKGIRDRYIEDAKNSNEKRHSSVNNFKKLISSDFLNGKDISEKEFDEVFLYLRTLASFQYLNKFLYKEGKIKEFNQKLRNLFDENKPLLDRILDFTKQDQIRFDMTTVFLYAYNIKKYPLLSDKVKTVVLDELTDDQKKSGSDEAAEIYGIKSTIDSEDVINGLRNFVLMNHLKDELGLTDFGELNYILYQYSDGEVSGPEAPQQEGVWYVEKTRENTHSDTSLVNSGLTQSLWSPEKNRADRNIYRAMKDIKKGDLVLHLVMDKNNLFIGVSKVKESAINITIPPENHWGVPGGTNGLQVLLGDYKELKDNLKWDDLSKKKGDQLKALTAKGGLFYTTDLELAQGKYLTRMPSELVSIINDVYKEEYDQNLPYFQPNVGHSREGTDGNDEGGHLQNRNIILHGPVGTGKTYLAQIIAKGILNDKVKSLVDIENLLTADETKLKELSSIEVDKKRFVRVTFHQSYGYEGFLA